MHAQRCFLVTMAVLGMMGAALPAWGTEPGTPRSEFVSDATAPIGWQHPHRGTHRHDHGHRHWRPDRHGRWPHRAVEHRHGRHGWHTHRHPHRHGRHRPHRDHDRDDWDTGAGIALGLLAGMLLFQELAEGEAGPAPKSHRNAGPLSLDAHSRQRQGRAIRDALDAGAKGAVTWQSPANRGGRASGTVRITRNGRDDFGNLCREYHQTIRVGKRSGEGYRVACLDRNGNWHLVGSR